MSVMAEKKVTLVLEYNCYLRESLATIWLIPRIVPEDSLEYESDEFPHVDDVVRILGPVASEIASEAYENLFTCLTLLDVNVMRYVIADD